MRSENYRADVAILDIVLQESDGITLAQNINNIGPCCQIIFLTAYLSYATRVYDAEHVYFVLKAEMEEQLEKALKKAAVKRGQALRDMLVVKNGTNAVVIPSGDVMYLERIVRRTKIVDKNGNPYHTALSPSALLDGAGKNFIRCHKSFYVNPQYVFSMEQNAFVMTDGTLIPISRAFHKTAKEQFFASFHPGNTF